MTTDAGQRLLEVHVLNGGHGESIIVRLPDGEWGVVDSFASRLRDPSLNPTVCFLKEREVKRLEFLCLTHPHDDHYRGMSHFFTEFSVARFWRFGGTTQADLQSLLKYLKGTARQVDDLRREESATDLQSTLREVAKRRKAGSLRVWHLSDHKPLYPEPTSSGTQHQLAIWSLAPSSNQVERYHESLRRCFTADGRLKSEPSQLKHNMLSVALLVRYGQTQLLLGGDVERDGWQDALETIDHGDLLGHAVKVSHHGSTNGYASGLWAAFSDGTSPFAVITPSRRHGLPHREAVEHIASHTSHLLTTCLPAITFLAPGQYDWWEDYSLGTQLALGATFRSARANRTLEVGICSLYFDDRGNCVNSKCTTPAGTISI